MHPIVQGFLHHPMAKRRPLDCALRIAQWQIQSMLKSEWVKSFGISSQLFVRRGMTGATGNVYYGLHEFDEMMFLLKAMRLEDAFLDVGANIGAYTVLVAKEIGAAVLSFEPSPITFDFLNRNVLLNQIDHLCETHQCCAGKSKGTTGFTKGLDTVNHIDPEATDNLVEVWPLDEMEINSDSIFAKIDVEGFESYVIQGGARLFQSGRVKALIMELNGLSDRFELDESEIISKLRAWGYNSYKYEAKTGRLFKLQASTDTNTIFIRNDSLHLIENRIRQADCMTICRTVW